MWGAHKMTPFRSNTFLHINGLCRIVLFRLSSVILSIKGTSMTNHFYERLNYDSKRLFSYQPDTKHYTTSRQQKV